MSVPFSTVYGGVSSDDWTLHFESADCADWAREDEADELHALYQSAGIPYTVTSYDFMPCEEDCPDWYRHPSLTPAERNPSLI